MEKETSVTNNTVDYAEKLEGALRFILAFYEPEASRYLDTNAWKNAENSARYCLKQYEESRK